MTLVARVTFAIAGGGDLLGLLRRAAPQERAAGRRRPQHHSLLLAQRRRQSRRQQDLDLADASPTTATIDVVNLDGDRVKRLADAVADEAVPPAAAAVGRDRRRRPAGARRPVPAARGAARRGALGHGPEDDAGRHARPEVEGLHRLQVQRPAQAHGQRDLAGRPRGEGLHRPRLAVLRDDVPRPAHRRRQAARGQEVRAGRAARTARSGTGSTTRASRSIRAPTSSSPRCATRPATSASRRPSSSRAPCPAVRASPCAGSPPSRRCAR